MNLAAIALKMILVLAPVEQKREVFPGWEESTEARYARMVMISEDIASAVELSCSKREGSSKKRCLIWSTSALVGVAKHESDFAPDVDLGKCYRGKDGKSSRCDGGFAHSMWQIRSGGEEAALFDTDRRAAAIEALRRMSRSMGACKGLPLPYQLSAYAGGKPTVTGIAAQRSKELWTLIERAKFVARGVDAETIDAS